MLTRWWRWQDRKEIIHPAPCLRYSKGIVTDKDILSLLVLWNRHKLASCLYQNSLGESSWVRQIPKHRRACRKCWKSTLTFKSLGLTLFLVFITATFNYSSLGENGIEENIKQPKQLLLKIVAGEARKLGEYMNTYGILKTCTCSSQTSWQAAQKKKSCSFWEYSGLKGVDRSFLELIAWRLCQPSFQTFEQNYHRYCILKSGFAVSTPCKFRICLRNGRRTHICFTREIVVSILSCFITRFLLLLWHAEEQEYSSPQLNSRNIRQQLGGGLCRFLSGAPSSWASGPSICRINSLHKASWWPASHPLAILEPASLIRVLRI